MYRFKWPVKFSSIKDWSNKQIIKLKSALANIRIKRFSKKGIAILSLLVFVFGINALFWWYRANRGGFEFQRSSEIEPPKEWEINLNEQFLDEEELRTEYKMDESSLEKDDEIPDGELKNGNTRDGELSAISDEEQIKTSEDVETISDKSDIDVPAVQTTTLLSTMAMPTMGKVITTFAVDSLVYSKTLEQWNSHHGIDIAGDLGTPVKAAMDGTVENVMSNDPKLGVVVVIDHGANIKTLYGNLASDKLVKKGQTVKKGQVIGSVGNTSPYEIEDPPHLHFEVLQDGKNIDPQQYLPKLN